MRLALLLLPGMVVGLAISGRPSRYCAARRHPGVTCEELSEADAAALAKMGIGSMEELEALGDLGAPAADTVVAGATGAAADDLECTGRVVTELLDASGRPLPERFAMAMRALQGEFSPDSGSDTERDEGNLLAGLVQFPATLPLKIVSTPGADVESLTADVAALAAGDEPPEVSLRLGGRVASISCSVRCESPGSLSAMRAALLQDPRVKMVF